MRIGEDGADPLVDEIAVVVPRDDLPIGQPLARHRRAEEALEEVALLLGGVDARLPRLGRHRFVLNRDPPDVDALALVRLDELRVVVRPRLPELRRQLSTVQHVAIRLHECRRTPRAGEERELSAGRREHLLDEWDAELSVVRDAERLERLVAFVDVRVAGGGEVAAVDVRAPERVADPLVGIVVGIEQLALLRRRELGEGLRGRVRERAADAEDRL